MNMNDYQDMAVSTAVYPNQGNNLAYTALGLTGEAGEFADKVKKVIRDAGGVATPDAKAAMAKELGDVLWYVANSAKELGYTMEDIAAKNISKLAARKLAGTLQGSGDDR